MPKYHGKKVIIIGLGKTGLSCIVFFKSKGIQPRVMDTRCEPPGLSKLPKDIDIWLGGLNEKWLLDAELIIVSPGFSLSHPSLIMAKKAGIEIIGDIELFVREVNEPIIAITGSNGKSTVTNMVSKMAECAGWKVGIGGNIGLPVLMLLGKSYQLYVLELSSFQLETTYTLKAEAATILNVTEDHMNRYPFGLQQYRTAKMNIYYQASACIVNAEDPLTFPIKDSDARCISFGKNKGDYRLERRNNQTWLTAYGEILMNCTQMKISGCHNYINALSALALAEVQSIPRENCLRALSKFHGLLHRFNQVYEYNGVRWIDDSKSTNIGSTQAALNSLDIQGTLHLLLGGDSKGANFLPLSSFLQNRKIQIYCFGKDGEKLTFLRPDATNLTETLEQAMDIIKKRVKAGDIVLLSPACSSLDQFENFEVRGNIFTKLARKIV